MPTVMLRLASASPVSDPPKLAFNEALPAPNARLPLADAVSERDSCLV
jgi:hypothetical protein